MRAHILIKKTNVNRKPSLLSLFLCEMSVRTGNVHNVCLYCCFKNFPWCTCCLYIESGAKWLKKGNQNFITKLQTSVRLGWITRYKSHSIYKPHHDPFHHIQRSLLIPNVHSLWVIMSATLIMTSHLLKWTFLSNIIEKIYNAVLVVFGYFNAKNITYCAFNITSTLQCLTQTYKQTEKNT